MTLYQLTDFFMWMTILNVALLLFWTGCWFVAKDLIYKMHSKWFDMPREAFNISFYAFIGLYKICVTFFALMPFLALTIMG